MANKRRRVLDQVRKTVEKFGLWKKRDKILVACSGGADSTALLSLLRELQAVYSLRLAVAHFNHRLRPAAAVDEMFVAALAQRWELPLYLRREDIRVFAKKHGLNLEEAGRQRRYEFLRKTAAKIGADRIATGHTMTDQAETVLMRLLRGTGPAGLTSIAPILAGEIIRPLIEVERKEIEAYLHAERIKSREDETNRDRRYLRNRVRWKLIPYLERNFDPRIIRHLARLAEISQEEEEFWGEAVRSEAGKAILSKGAEIALDAGRLSSLSRALARRLVRLFLSQVKGDLRRISFEDVESVRRLAEQKSVSLPGGLMLKREKGHIFLKLSSRRPLSYEYLWDGRSKLKIKELGFGFTGKIILGEENPLTQDAPVVFDDSQRAYLDADKIRFPFVVRNRRAGDRFRPLGAPGQKKLKEIMRAKGIPQAQRHKHPVFLSGGKIVWILGLPVAEEFKVTAKTRRIVILQKS
ncbi:MAG: tRNA lysidine(34) synthetase TilS [Acidobacteriota bacterium]